jgi:hypothetical protein
LSLILVEHAVVDVDGNEQEASPFCATFPPIKNPNVSNLSIPSSIRRHAR